MLDFAGSASIKDLLDSASIRARADIDCTFRFLGSPFTISTNQLEALSFFQKMYADFSLRTLKEKNVQSDYYVINEPDLLETPFIWADEKIYICQQPRMLPLYAHSIITNSIMARIQSHFIFHAAAVSWRDQGMIILGDSCNGKSTITLELIRRGFQFFTDDVTCLHRKNHQICPFPRALGLRQSAFGLFKGFIDADSHVTFMPYGQKKIFLLPSAIPKVKISDPCLPKFLICLSSYPRGESGYESQNVRKYQDTFHEDKKSPDDKKFLYLGVDRFEDGMIKDLMALSGVEGCKKLGENPFPVLKLTGRRGYFLLPDIENLCSRHRVTLLQIARSEKTITDYSQDPYMERIPKSVAMRELLRGFRGGWTSAVLKEANSGMASMLFNLSPIMKGVECYRMIPGELGKMADLLYDLATGKVAKHE